MINAILDLATIKSRTIEYASQGRLGETALYLAGLCFVSCALTSFATYGLYSVRCKNPAFWIHYGASVVWACVATLLPMQFLPGIPSGRTAIPPAARVLFYVSWGVWLTVLWAGAILAKRRLAARTAPFEGKP